jgi:hypothetical protein
MRITGARESTDFFINNVLRSQAVPHDTLGCNVD